jgi:Kef-type K+ transport system membrane component KefB
MSRTISGLLLLASEAAEGEVSWEVVDLGGLLAGLVQDAALTHPALTVRMEPIASLLVPIFFVLMGMRADFRALADPSTLLLVGALAAAAIVGKLACALGAPGGTDRIAVAFGMVPRGEVSLVFANLGLTLTVGGKPLLDTKQYSALVAVVVVTTLLTPLALKSRITSRREGSASSPSFRS